MAAMTDEVSRSEKTRMRAFGWKALLGSLLAAAGLVAFSGCDVDVDDDGTPDVDIHESDPPDIDVHKHETPDVDINESPDVNIREAPDVDINEAPDVDVNPDAKTKEPEAPQQPAPNGDN